MTKSIIVGHEEIESESIELSPGKNIKIYADKENNKIIIEAEALNKTNVKVGPFMLSHEHVEIEAGPGILISSAMPNKIKISVNVDKYTADLLTYNKRMAGIEDRLLVIEKAFSKILKFIKGDKDAGN